MGDLHVENFGTWRDAEGRLIWGVNDFDEAFPLAYTNDLVRLAVSAHLAVETRRLSLTTQTACKTILAGYREGLEEGGRPFVLEENHKWLREAATAELRDPVHFWGKMNALPTVRGEIPKSARKALEELLPERGLACRVAHRVAGFGSLGRERYVAITDWGGGRVAREAKAILPSACVWANEGAGPQKIFYEDIITRAARVLDPFVRLCGKWIVRRLAGIVPGSIWLSCLRNAMRNGFSTPWVLRLRISISEAAMPSRRCGVIWAGASPIGSSQPFMK